MLVRCIHGFFIFTEDAPGELSRFVRTFSGLSLVTDREIITFKTLSSAPTYSIQNTKYLGALASKTFEGKPWEVMRENGLVYNYQTDSVVPITTIKTRAEIFQATNYYISAGLIMPGSLTDDGKRVTDYSARYLFDTGRFKYSEVTVE